VLFAVPVFVEQVQAPGEEQVSIAAVEALAAPQRVLEQQQWTQIVPAKVRQPEVRLATVRANCGGTRHVYHTYLRNRGTAMHKH
jgi:hypothetical protein